MSKIFILYPIFVHILDFCPEFAFLSKICIFVQNLNFCPKFAFLSKISIFLQTLDFCSKFRFLSKILNFKVTRDRLCGLKDHDAVRTLVRDIAIGAIIPHLEKEARKLYEIIQNRKALHRSIFSATKKFFGGSQSKNYVTEKYTESVEIQTRRFVSAV